MTLTPACPPGEAMNVPSHVLEADLNRLSARVLKLEKRVEGLDSQPPAPATLPVDKMQLADYAKTVGPTLSEESEEDEEEEVFANPNLSKSDLQELTAAVRDFLEWSDPQSHLNDTSWKMVTSSARDRLERALSVAEKELRRASDD